MVKGGEGGGVGSCDPLEPPPPPYHHNDIIVSMDKGQVKAVTLLDWSAAFDTIDHAILTNRLTYGMDYLDSHKFGFLLI